MRVVANIASLAQGFMLENKRPGLLTVALGARFVASRHGQSTGGFEDVRAVRIMALNTIHVALGHRVMLRHPKLGLDGDVTIKTGSGTFAGVNDELASSSASFNVLAAGAVTGFAPALACHSDPFDMQSAVGAGREDACDVRVTIRAGLIADKRRARHGRGQSQSPAATRTGIENNSDSSREHQPDEEPEIFQIVATD